ncbi:piggyBac transposable element-derived protein 2-like [Penaeus monodon]|uniref:piggyBac transposable element-derived protein 2-like n=1 Tax=Penaeus monodon TaxID=6687 RepID=UPI0018A6FA98|nr:piggyBac transposable element-derived protein 2-like [Penaeus monodon]
MSRQLSVRRGRKPRISPAVRDLSFSDVDDPQPSTSGIQRLRNAPDPLLYLYSTDEEDYTPLKLKLISTRFDGDDSHWEGSEFDTEESGVDDDSRGRFRLCPAGGYLFGLRRAPRRTIVDETNRYVRQNPRTPSSHMKGWEDTTVREVRSYVGLRFLMGLQSKRDQREWWSTDPLMSSSVFAKTMTRDRYDALTSALHFADNEGEHPAEDRLWKLRPVLDVLESTYRSAFVPNKNVTVDESLWAFKGRHHALQYNPSKRARRGLKVYKLCSSNGPEAGYMAAFKIYMGQDRGVFPSSMKAVTDLLEKADLFDKGYQLYTDNWYTSPTLPLPAGPEDQRCWDSTSEPAWHALGPAGESGTNRLPVQQDRNDLPSVGGQASCYDAFYRPHQQGRYPASQPPRGGEVEA